MKCKAPSRHVMTAVLAVAVFCFAPAAAADWLERYENAMFVDSSAMQVTEADGVERRSHHVRPRRAR